MTPTWSLPNRLSELERAAKAAGAGPAQLELARIYLAGREVPRDIVRARTFFERAAASGERAAVETYRAFVANGTGGAPDWQAALRLLEADRANGDAAEQLALISAMHLDDNGQDRSSPQGEVLSHEPRMVRFRSFVSHPEADYLIARATPRFRPALVVHPITGQQIPDPIRTSDLSAFPLALEQPAIHAINKRIAAASCTDVHAGEPLTVLRYRPGQQYRAHLDTLPSSVNQRVATMLIYLNNGYEGGETRFPKLDMTVRGRKGDALLFFNTRKDGKPNILMLHEGVQVLSGEKVIASRWIRQSQLQI